MLLRLFSFMLLIITSCCFAEEITIVLTGTSEIGQETIERIVEGGKKVLVIGRDSNKLEKLSQRHNCYTFQIAFEDSSRILEFNEYLREENFLITGFVLITPRPPFAREILPPESSWFEMFRICYTRPLELLKIALPYFRENASLVILSGVTSVEALPEFASYGVLRKMWLAEAKSLAWELGSRGIIVNTVSAGFVMTSLYLEKWEKEANSKHIGMKELLIEKAAKYPSGRISTKKDIAEAIYFFLSGASNITGQNLVVDGGLTQVY